jgi:hypothetical protein
MSYGSMSATEVEAAARQLRTSWSASPSQPRSNGPRQIFQQLSRGRVRAVTLEIKPRPRLFRTLKPA